VIAFPTQALLPWATECATVRYRAAGGTFADVSTRRAARYLVTSREAQRSNGVYLAGDEKFTLPAEDFPDQPRPGDRLTHGGRDLVVIDSSGGLMLKFWSVSVRSLTLAYALRDLATVRRPNPTPDAAGVRAANPATLAADVPCRLQPDGWDAVPDLDGRLTTRSRYVCYLGQPLTLAAGDALLVNGVLYEATAQSDIAQIDELTSVRCERIS
jgi:hypothetical protein